MKRDWKPGDVVIISPRTKPTVAIYVQAGEVSDGPAFVAASGDEFNPDAWPDARPVVVIDTDDREAAARLLELYFGNARGDIEVVRMQKALREFASPTPPKPVVTPDMVAAMREQVRLDREQSAYWNEREIDHGGLSAVDAWLGSLADHLGVDS